LATLGGEFGPESGLLLDVSTENKNNHPQIMDTIYKITNKKTKNFKTDSALKYQACYRR